MLVARNCATNLLRVFCSWCLETPLSTAPYQILHNQTTVCLSTTALLAVLRIINSALSIPMDLVIPTRLLDIGVLDDTRSKTRLGLVDELIAEHIEYLTMSHCWGETQCTLAATLASAVRLLGTQPASHMFGKALDVIHRFLSWSCITPPNVWRR